MIDLDPFTSVTFANTVSGDQVEFDQMRTGVVPEPGCMALLMLTVAAAGVIRRRRES